MVHDRATGRPLAGLAPSDFEVLEDGFPREIVACESTESDLDAVLVIRVRRPPPRDRSAGKLRAQLREFVAEFGPEDRIAVLCSDPSPRVLARLTKDSRIAMAAIVEAFHTPYSHASGWRLRDAAVAGTELFPREIEHGRRRAVLLVGDQGEAGSRTSIESAVTTLLEKSAVFYAAAVRGPSRWKGTQLVIGRGSGKPRPRSDPPPEVAPVAGVDELAVYTGGEILRGSDAVALMSEALQKLRARYMIYFRPSSTLGVISSRRVMVALSRTGRERYPTAQVRGQREYVK